MIRLRKRSTAMRLRRHPRRAVTLIEAVLFIAVALGLIVGGLVFFQQAQTASRTADIVRLISGLVVEVRAVKQANGTQGNLGLVLSASGALPAPTVIETPYNVNGSTCHIKSPWGECIEVIDVHGNLNFYVWGMPPEVCTRVLSHDAMGNGPLGDGRTYSRVIRDPDGYASGGSWTLSPVQHTTSSDGALDPDKAGQICSYLNGNNSFVTIGFRWE
jgi:hypothetical protein